MGIHIRNSTHMKIYTKTCVKVGTYTRKYMEPRKQPHQPENNPPTQKSCTPPSQSSTPPDKHM